MAYVGMITSTGGNTSSQVCTLAIQGITTGTIKIKNMNQTKRLFIRKRSKQLL